jgi:predicted nucleic acid-binding protein
MRLFLDANVLFAAAHSPDGRARALFEMANHGLCMLITSAHAIEEASRNVAVTSPTNLGTLEELLTTVESVPEAGRRLVAWAADRGLPPNDAPILAAAATTEADALVTGDHTHFGHLFGNTVGGVRVLSVADAIRAVVF